MTTSGPRFVEQWPLYGGQVMAQALWSRPGGPSRRTVSRTRSPRGSLRPSDTAEPLDLHVAGTATAAATPPAGSPRANTGGRH
jgi:acyl-CoA thioesterase